MLYVYYEGTHGKEPYMGTGKDEIEGWMFMFNGPHGRFAANARTEQVMVKKVCMAAGGLGADIDKSAGYTQLRPASTCRKFKLSLSRQKKQGARSS